MSEPFVGSLFKDIIAARGELRGDLIDDILADKARNELTENPACSYCRRRFKSKDVGRNCVGCGAPLG
jgi:tRNA(Ile2) C34 agmatinyltransferase TiaS